MDTRKNFIIISFYTKGFYEKIINKYLIPSLRRFNLSYYIEEIPSRKNWILNTNLKATFCKKMLEKFPDKKLVWMDADSEIVEYPYEFDRDDYDIAINKIDWLLWFYYRKNKVDIKEIVSGVIGLKNDNIVKSIVNEWIDRIYRNPYRWEQKHLADTILAHEKELKILYLPQSYCYFNTLPNGSKPKVPFNPVIKQYQVSRQSKFDDSKL